MNTFLKFPTTPHLTVLEGGTVRDDKVFSLDERNRFLDGDIIVEEKIDGANLGISFDSDGRIQTQNRGSFLQLPMTGQWKTAPEWLLRHSESLFDALTDRYLLCGEWCYAKHSVFYSSLPDWFIGFDVFDLKAGRFVNKTRRDGILASLALHAVPCLASGRLSLAEITLLLNTSNFSDAAAEGLYLRRDDGDWLSQRAKLVRADFIQSIDQHWSRGPLEVNRLAIHQPQGVSPRLPVNK